MTFRKNSALDLVERLRVQSVVLLAASACTFAPLNSTGADAYGNSQFASTPLPQGNAKPFAVIAEAAPIPPGEEPGKAVLDERPSVEINAGDEVSPVPRRFQWAFRLNLRSIYDDNIFLSNTDRVGDLYFAIEPGVTVGFGDIVGREQNFIRLDYAPSIFLYIDNSDASGIQHLIRLDGQYRFGHLGVSIAQDVQLLDGANQSVNVGVTTGGNLGPAFNLDAGGEAKVNIYSTRANFSYDLTGKTFLSGGIGYTAYDYESLINSETLWGNLYINYNYSPKLVIGVGGAIGYNWVGSTNPDEIFEQVNARLSYQVSGKVNLDASAGVEFRQFEEGLGEGDYVSPVYELGATYRPFDGTTITVRGSRRTQNSAVLLGQDYANANVTVGVRQRFFHRFYLGLNAGYENSDYFSTVEFVDASRSDNYFFIQPTFDITLTDSWTAGFYYLHRQNDSSEEGSSFYDNQFAVRTSLTF